MEPPSRVSEFLPWVSFDQISSSRVCFFVVIVALESKQSSDIVPVIMAGIIGIYGLVVSVLISDGLQQELALYTAFIQLGAGLSVGLSGLAAGFAIGIVGDAGVRGTAQQPRLFVGMILILIFAEVLGSYFFNVEFIQYLMIYRSLRTHRRSFDELQGNTRCKLLVGTCGERGEPGRRAGEKIRVRSHHEASWMT